MSVNVSILKNEEMQKPTYERFSLLHCVVNKTIVNIHSDLNQYFSSPDARISPSYIAYALRFVVFISTLNLRPRKKQVAK